MMAGTQAGMPELLTVIKCEVIKRKLLNCDKAEKTIINVLKYIFRLMVAGVSSSSRFAGWRLLLHGRTEC